MPQGMAAAGEGCRLLGEREDAGMGVGHGWKPSNP